jgi:predicted nucleic acid-binding protein
LEKEIRARNTANDFASLAGSVPDFQLPPRKRPGTELPELMAVLVDTSVRVQQFRKGVAELPALIAAQEVASHAVVVGELTVGGLPNRANTLAELQGFHHTDERPAAEVLDLIEQHRLYNIGLSWGAAQLLAAAIHSGVPIWTPDAALNTQAQAFGVACTPPTP